MANYFFGVASSVLVALVITLVVDKVISKRSDLAPDEPVKALSTAELKAIEVTPEQRRALRTTGLAALGFIAFLAAAMIPASSPLRGEGGSLVESPVISGMSIVLFLFFSLLGWVYGRMTGTFRAAGDIVDALVEGTRTFAPILVLFFAISQFLAYFKWTNIGNVIAIEGAETLKQMHLSGWSVLVGIAVLITFMNLVITSGSALWALAAPVLIPMLMLIGIEPRGHSGHLPRRRLGHQLRHPDEPLLRDGARLHPAAQRSPPASARWPRSHPPHRRRRLPVSLGRVLRALVPARPHPLRRRLTRPCHEKRSTPPVRLYDRHECRADRTASTRKPIMTASPAPAALTARAREVSPELVAGHPHARPPGDQQLRPGRPRGENGPLRELAVHRLGRPDHEHRHPGTSSWCSGAPGSGRGMRSCCAIRSSRTCWSSSGAAERREGGRRVLGDNPTRAG
ncbi:hypothetical protein SALBM311S_10086 [Streptomyces alboniger]